ncbi:PREDICTED: histone-lysine N-methyltransferase SETMAR-like [Dinoponera quadriceps]|uniref:Histone-lysine N-methyltransferase SETMAR-like n=1 Tax=Dinoponera quadriceps TaxID=609295 RepID=A0A6P3Y8X6_DINQU|nr:PREDICTED: histone-lysine N-methyltransferase SETMAR-like [Dinoponera quadriceps]
MADQEKFHFRHSMLYEFQLGYNATEDHKNLCFVFGPSKVKVRTLQRWFEKFRSGDMKLQDEPRIGRLKELDDNILRALVGNEPLLTTREIGDKLSVSHITIENHLNKLGFVYKWCRWIPRKLSEKNIADQISIASSLLVRQQYEPFLDRLVTGDEKWIVYDNVVRKRVKIMPGISPPTLAKANLQQKS